MSTRPLTKHDNVLWIEEGGRVVVHVRKPRGTGRHPYETRCGESWEGRSALLTSKRTPTCTTCRVERNANAAAS